MLYIIFNHDGSIKTLIVGESIQQGDHLTKQVFTKVVGLSNSEYTCSGDFVLPSGEISNLIAQTDTDETYGDGYSITLTEAQTLYAGNLKMNLRLVNLQGQVLCTYQVTLKINPTAYNPNETNITEAQYNSFLQTLNSYYTKFQIDAKFVTLDTEQTITDEKTFTAKTYMAEVEFSGDLLSAEGDITNYNLGDNNGHHWNTVYAQRLIDRDGNSFFFDNGVPYVIKYGVIMDPLVRESDLKKRDFANRPILVADGVIYDKQPNWNPDTFVPDSEHTLSDSLVECPLGICSEELGSFAVSAVSIHALAETYQNNEHILCMYARYFGLPQDGLALCKSPDGKLYLILCDW